MKRPAGLVVLTFCALMCAPATSSASPAHPGWRSMPGPRLSGSHGAGLSSISCPSAKFCMAVGTKQTGSGVIAEALGGGHWRMVAPQRVRGGLSVLSAVSCRSPSWCVAVGYAPEQPSGKLPLAEYWNGHTWRAQVIQTQVGLTPEQWTLFASVSCPTETRCYAVGQEGPEQADQQLDLLAIWTPEQGWTYTSLNDTQTIVLSLAGVSCSSLDDCFAVGVSNWKDGNAGSAQALNYAYEDINGTYQWGGTTSSADYQGVALNAVACPADYRCIAVGTGASGAAMTSPLASETFTLTSGTEKQISAPAGVTAASLDGIACRSTSSCVSVGYVLHGMRAAPLSESWNGQSWTIAGAPRPKAYAAALSSIACPTRRECIAVGDQQITSRAKPEVLIERRL